jgi:hypothetical protein
MKKISFALITLLFLATSCSKDKDDNPGTSSRVVKYEITGNFTGSLIASYTTAPGGTANEAVPSQPWTKEITYASTVTAATMVLSGNGGVTGQKVTLVVKRGGTAVGAPTVFTADAAGGFSSSGPVIVF